MAYLWVALGSALGGAARYWCSGLAARLIGESFPWGTLIVNVVGSFVIGAFAALTVSEGRFLIPSDIRIFVTVGFCGGYTTFSSFSVQTLALMREGEWVASAANIGLSVILCIAAVWLGQVVVTLLTR
jgi:fluoride exporter